MRIKNKRGQSTVEYVLLVTAVVAVIIAFLSSPSGVLQTQLNNSFSTAANDIGTEMGALNGSHVLQPVSGTGTPPYTINVAP